jgi:hypothetical protein
MAYIGQGIKQGTFKVLDTSGNTYNGSNTTFNLGTQVGSAAQLLVSHDGVIQKAGTDYTLATGGTQITFSTAPASGASIFIVEISGAVGGTVTPSDTSVTADKLNTALLTGHTDIGADIVDADLFLIDDGAGGTLRKTTASRIKTYTNAGVSSALDDITTGDAASTLATSAGNITIDAQGNDTDIIFKGTDNNSDTTFWTMDGSEQGNLVPGSTSTGIYLGVNSATAANLLDFYEEGTWTPRLQGRSTAGTFNYDSGGGDGFYQRIGEIVHVWFWLSGSLSSGSGELQISGLPYNMSGGQTQYREMCGAQNFDGRNPRFISKFNNTTWELYEYDGSQSDTNINVANSSTDDVGSSSVQMWGSMTYKTA